MPMERRNGVIAHCAWGHGMTTFESWSVGVGMAAVAVNLILFAVVALQLRALRRQVELSERIERGAEARARRQATVEFYAATHARRIRFMRLFEDRGLMTADEVCDAAKTDIEVRHQLIDYLNYYEFLAVGVRTETYDYETVRRLASSRIMRIAVGYQPYIQWSRQTQDRPQLFIELERLSDQLRSDTSAVVA